MPSRYTIIGTLSAGGMGTVFLARVSGSAGFSRLVAIKRLHPELAAQSEFIAMMVDEARLASQIRHANVVDTLDLVASDGALSLVLEYVEGASLGVLLASAWKDRQKIPIPIALAVVQGFLRGLDAAHEARGGEGQPLGIVHRDVSPQNVLVGIDGVPRVIDFGIAKAMGRMTETRPGEVRGKFAYMAPEQLLGRPATRQVDVYASGVILWELLSGVRLFTAEDQRAVTSAVIQGEIRPPSAVNPDVPPELDAIVLEATARELSRRYLTAREFLDALAPFPRASDDEVGAWVRGVAGHYLAKRSALLDDVAPEQSRSIEDLLAELAQSTTGETPNLRAASQPTLPPPHGLTSAGVAVSQRGRRTGGPHIGGILATCAAALAVVLVGMIVRRRAAVHAAPSEPPSASIQFVPVEADPTPSVAITAPPVDSATAITAASAVPAAVPSRRRPPRGRPGSTKKSDPDLNHQ